MRGLWVLGRTLRFFSLRTSGQRARRRDDPHQEAGGAPVPDEAPSPPAGDAAGEAVGEAVGDPLDEADRRRAEIGGSWFVTPGPAGPVRPRSARPARSVRPGGGRRRGRRP